MQSDSLHRLTKLLLDTGEAASIEDAFDRFDQYGVKIRLGRVGPDDVGGQILALTAINCASRSFRGNVQVEATDFELTAPGFQGKRFHDFLSWAGVKTHLPEKTATWPRIVVNDESFAERDVLAWADGWQFGVGRGRCGADVFVPACVGAAGLAVSEAFSILRADNPYAGRREVRLSLWDPSAMAYAPAPTDIQVPSQGSLWLVGLGHLGQAYAWTLGFMPAGTEPVLLQDIDRVSESTLSTSMVSHFADVGQRKTRIVARWLESCGYQTALIERRFDETQRVRPEEPTTALFGVDNAAARRVSEAAGYRLIIDVGLGSGPKDFRALRLRTFPGPARAAKLWASESTPDTVLALAYQRLLEATADACGVTTLASRAVGAPFVGCVAAAYAVAERVRRQIGGPATGLLDLHLREPERLDVG
jgi:hypothetical protein